LLDELELAERAVTDALEAGASQAEAGVTIAQRFSAEARGPRIEKVQQSTARSLNLRVFVAGAKAALSTTDLTPDGLRAFVRQTVDAARYVAFDPYAGLPEPSGPGGVASDADDLEIFCGDVAARRAETKLEDAVALEAFARAYDPRIVNSGGAHVADSLAEIVLANSSGFRGRYRASSAMRSVGPIAQDGAVKRVASYGTAAHGYAGLESTEAVATLAARRAVESCGARKPQTMRCPVIFERDVAAAVLGDVFTALSAASVANGNSFLADKIGSAIGSPLVTLIDDGRLRGGLGTSPFDAEGVPTRRTVVCDAGRLETFLYDAYHGRKLGAASTGNAAQGGIGPNNFFLVAGRGSLEELIAATPRGVLVLETIGFATESVTGTYSRGARGFAIENGERAYPIDEFTIAGNLLEMLAGIDAVGADLRFDSSIVAPSFRVAEMTVSGS
jgi:PmbA protein